MSLLVEYKASKDLLYERQPERGMRAEAFRSRRDERSAVGGGAEETGREPRVKKMLSRACARSSPTSWAPRKSACSGLIRQPRPCRFSGRSESTPRSTTCCWLWAMLVCERVMGGECHVELAARDHSGAMAKVQAFVPIRMANQTIAILAILRLLPQKHSLRRVRHGTVQTSFRRSRYALVWRDRRPFDAMSI